MELILAYISMAVLMIYAAFGLFIFLGFYAIPVKKQHKAHKNFISVIIPFRNEEKNLPGLLESIQQINYPADEFEIIFVNDHSTDKGPGIIERSGIVNAQLLNVAGEGKKAAVAHGIEQAKGEMLVGTDADCSLPPEWLNEINAASGNVMVMGPVQLYPVKNFMHYFQELELAALQSITAATAKYKIPLMSNGANLAYQKKEFNEVALKKETPSGDDIFLLEDFKKKKLSICFLWNINSIVKTRPVNSLKELVQQKVRWASKSKYYTNYATTSLGILTALVNLVVLANLALPYASWQMSILVVAAKMIIDLMIMLPYMILIKKPSLVLLLLPFVLMYPLYFFYVLILSIRGKFTWKERRYHA